MQRDFSNGTDGVFNCNAHNASGESYASAFGTQEDQQIENENEENYPDFNQSNRRLDLYHLYFSSRL